MENSDDIRLIVKIAQLYYEQDMTQAQIARELVFTAPPSAACLNEAAIRELSPSPSTMTTTKISGWSSN